MLKFYHGAYFLGVPTDTMPLEVKILIKFTARCIVGSYHKEKAYECNKRRNNENS